MLYIGPDPWFLPDQRDVTGKIIAGVPARSETLTWESPSRHEVELHGLCVSEDPREP